MHAFPMCQIVTAVEGKSFAIREELKSYLSKEIRKLEGFKGLYQHALCLNSFFVISKKKKERNKVRKG